MNKDKRRLLPQFNCLFACRRTSLRWRLLSLVGLMLMITLVVIGLEVIYFIYNNEQRTWQGRQSEATRYAGEIVAAFLEGAQNTLRVVSLLEGEQLRAQPQLMTDLLQESPTLLEVIRLDGQGQIIASAYRDAPLLANLFTIPQSRWFLESRAGRLYLDAVQLSAESESYLIIGLPSPDGGVVAARLHMRLLWDVVASLHFGETGQAYVVNQDGLVIAHTDRKLPIANVSLTDRPEIAASLAASGQSWAGSYVNFQGQEVVGVAAPVTGTDWLVLTELPTREAFATSRTAVLIFGLGLALFGLLMMLLMSRLLQQTILTPMEKLRDGAERLGGGDLAYCIDLKQQNEVGQVAAAFNDMAARLRRQHQELRQRHAELEVMVQTSLSLTANLELKTVLDTILNSTFQLLPQIEDVHLFLYQRQRLEFAASLWADGRKDYLIAEPRPGGMTYQVARKGEIMIVPDIQTHPLYATAPAEWQGALVSLPLKIGAGVVGVMNVAYAEAHQFSEAELRVLRLLGDQTAIAIENARLYEQAQSELTERQRTAEKLRQLNEELEDRISARTAELTRVNAALRVEVAERERAEAQIRASLQEKEVLLKEIHHRVKNNLQVISSLLNLQADSIGDEQIRLILQDSQNRVRSMALIHQKLYQAANLAQIDFGEYIQDLAADLFRSQEAYARRISLNVETDHILLDIDKAVPCGLIMNELVSNTLKHAFPNGQSGQISLELRTGPDHQVDLTVTDNGIGLPPGLDFRKAESLGLQLVNTLVDQLGGTLELRSEQGTQVKLTFVYQPQKEQVI